MTDTGTRPSTSLGLRLIANALEGLPGLPKVAVTVSEDWATIQVVTASGADDETRCTAVDLLLAVLGADEPARVSETQSAPVPYLSYSGQAAFGAYDVSVFAPVVTVEAARRDQVWP